MYSSLNLRRHWRRLFSAPSTKVAVYPAISWGSKLIGFFVMVALFSILGWFGFDMGRKSAGYDSSVAKSNETKLRESLEQHRNQNLDLSRKVVNLEGKLKMAISVQENVSREMSFLSDENNRLKEELVFFETLMSSGKEPGGVSIARFEVSPVSKPGEFEYRILVVQSEQRVKEFRGYFNLTTYYTSAGDENGGIVGVSQATKKQLQFKFYQRSVGRFKLPEGSTLVEVEARVFKEGNAQSIAARNVKLN